MDGNLLQALITAYVFICMVTVHFWWGWAPVSAMLVGWLILPIGLIVLLISKVTKRRISILGIEISYD